jgi:ethanolamine utilization protein EutQ (cupin superfamily)
MTTKLTLSIDEEIVKKAKRVSQIRGKSVSKIIEEFISSLPEKDEAEETAVDKIKKIMKGKITNPNVDWKQAKEEHLTNKYGI